MNISGHGQQEHVPLFGVYRPAASITEEHIMHVRDVLVEAGIFEVPAIDKALRPLYDGPRSMIMASGEISRLYTNLHTDIRERGFNDLVENLHRSLPPAAYKYSRVPSRPAVMHVDDRKKVKRILTVGSQGGSAFDERRQVTRAIENFYGPQAFPKTRIWSRDADVVGVRIARSKSRKTARVVDCLNTLLKNEDGLLPPILELGPIRID